MGSSPRVRGTLLDTADYARFGGIIPACAGNTCRWVPARAVWRDHPRVCGEHARRRAGRRSPGGSSPRVRGTQADTPVAFAHGGIIPACAGNTKRSIGDVIQPWDHPRVCGEHPDPPARVDGDEGSSPRVRGTRVPVRPVSLRTGIIPACAGNTGRALPFERLLWDHPRVCGEHEDDDGNPQSEAGSSPRVRGTPEWHGGVDVAPGIIPACAGNTRLVFLARWK